MTLWLIADTHFGHANVLTFGGRDGGLIRPGFGSVEEMDETMVDRWNAVVRQSDHVYHLGDVAMRREHLRTLTRLNGHLRLVRGNHDVFKTRFYLPYFDEIYGSRVLDNCIMTHIPIHPDSMGRFKVNIHGHTHANPSPAGPYVSVCVERTDYRPVTFEEIKDAA